MPSGIPPSITTFTTNVQEQISTFITYLQIPSYNDTSTHFQIAVTDSIQASRSTYQLFKLSFRPLFILLALLSKYALILLRILSEHSIYHGINASKELWRQIKVGSIWFVNFQKGLSRTAVYMEIGFCLLCIGLYMVRRYLQRKKYFQKLKRWYTSKKKKVQLKYYNVVDQVAQTSQILALLLPHILYGTLTLALKYFTPSLVQYLANSTILSDIISFYIPFVRTVIVVYKYKNLISIAERERMESQKIMEDEKKQKSKNNMKSTTKSRRGLLSLFSSSTDDDNNDSNSSSSSSSSNDITLTKKKGKSHVADAYKKAASKGNKSTVIDTNTGTKKSYLQTKSKPTKITPTILNEDELNDISQEAAELLKYWIVYGILTAFIQTATLLPILGRIFFNANPTNAKKAAASMSRWRKNKNRVSWLEKIKLSTGFLEECKLFFFAWLRLLPISLTSGRRGGSSNDANNDSATGSISGDIKNRIKALEKKAQFAASTQKSTSIRRKTSKSEVPFSNHPLDIVYDRLAPIIVSLVSTSTSVVNDRNSNDVSDPLQAFKTKCATFSRTVLEAMVWTKLISDSTKNFIINIFVQCTSILPAAVTMVMPSYFTNYGIIYVRLIVPSANSSSSYDAFIALKKEVELYHMIDSNGLVEERWVNVSSNINRFLQYWIIQAIVSSIVMSFSPVLAWIPLSTHMTWLLWAYVQLESTTKKLYNTLEWDLVAFGILKKSDNFINSDKSITGDTEVLDVNDTTSMQVLNSIMKKVPGKMMGLDSNSELKNDIQDEDKISETFSRNVPNKKDPISIESKNNNDETTSKTKNAVNRKESQEKLDGNDNDCKESAEEAASDENMNDGDRKESQGSVEEAESTCNENMEDSTVISSNSNKAKPEDNDDYVCISAGTEEGPVED